MMRKSYRSSRSSVRYIKLSPSLSLVSSLNFLCFYYQPQSRKTKKETDGYILHCCMFALVIFRMIFCFLCLLWPSKLPNIFFWEVNNSVKTPKGGEPKYTHSIKKHKNFSDKKTSKLPRYISFGEVECSLHPPKDVLSSVFTQIKKIKV